MRWVVRPSTIPHGDCTVPGDKSISHRALMLGSLAEDQWHIHNLASGADVASTRACLEALGCRMEDEEAAVRVYGGRLQAPTTAVDAGNSGTTMRLLSGILAGQPFTSTLTGDSSLLRRPMQRISSPLTEMGARVSTVDGHGPIRIEGGHLRAISFAPDVPSAQVKSCVLLAALFADGVTTVTELVRTRDHTERLFAACGIPVTVDGLKISVAGGSRPRPMEVDVPGDFSSAAFVLAAGALAGEVVVRKVGLNPTRTAFLRVLQRMRCDVEVIDEGECAGEPFGNVVARKSALRSVCIEGAEAAEMLDEMPLIALLAALAEGETRVTGAGELRVKESDRIAAITRELNRLGADIRELPDGFVVRGRSREGLTGATCDSHGDHRIAMMLALAGLVARGETTIEGVESAAISYPTFAETMTSMGASIVEG